MLAAYRYRHPLVDLLLHVRAARKATLLARFLEKGQSVLDVGAGEGYVGRELAERPWRTSTTGGYPRQKQDNACAGRVRRTAIALRFRGL